MPTTPCVIPTCWKSSISRHRFPQPRKYKEVFNKWVILCGNKRLVTEMTPERVYDNCRICSLHFLPEDFRSNRLKNGVLPSLSLPDPLESIDDAVPSTTQQVFVKVESGSYKTADQSNIQLTDPLSDNDSLVTFTSETAANVVIADRSFCNMQLTDPLSDDDSPSTSVQDTTADVIEVKQIEEPAIRCRVCWEEKRKEALILVTKLWTKESPKTIKEIILICVPTMSIQDNSYICINCYQQLKEAHKFIERCLKTESLLVQQAAKVNLNGDGSSILANILERSIEKGNKIRIVFENPQSIEDEPIDERSEQEIEIHPNPLDDYDDNSCDDIFTETIADCDSTGNPSQISVSQNTTPQALVDLLDFAPFNVRAIAINKEMSREHREGLLQEGINIVDMSEKSKKKRILYLSRDIFFCSLKCDKCNLHFKTRTEYADHIHLHKKGKIKVSDEPAFTCTICGGDFISDQDYRMHCIRFHSVSRPHQCKRCSKKFYSFKKLKEHEVEFEGGENGKCILTCKKCNKQFSTQKQLQSHEADVADAPCCDYLKCKICSEKFTKEGFKEHCEVVHPNYTCSYCGKSLSSASGLYTHETNVHRAKPGMCHECGKIIKTPKMLQHHIEFVHGKNKYICDKCPRQFKSKLYLWKHLRKMHVAENRVKKFACEKCGKMFIHKDGLNQHMNLVHIAQAKFNCPKCGEGFVRKDYLQRHTAFHEKYLQFTCSVCNRSFISESTLITHQDIGHDENGKPLEKGRKSKRHNSGPKKYGNPCVCNICYKVLASQLALKLHYKTHLKIREFTCQKCEITLQTHTAYKNHLKRHEDPNFDLSCNICHVYHSTQEELERHKQQVHKNLKYQCKHCPAKFGRKHLLFSHESIKHSEENAKKEELYKLLTSQPVIIAPRDRVCKTRKGVKHGAFLEDVDQILDQLINRNEELRDDVQEDPVEDNFNILSEEYELCEEVVACEQIIDYMEQ